MSRGSQHSLMTSGRAHSARVDSGRSGSMKCIVTVGIILPLLAAIIGAVAWTLSNDSVHKRSQSSPLYHGGHSSYRSRDHEFEERNDDGLIFGQKLPIGAAVSKDVLGPDVEEEREVLPPGTPGQPERDPLYVVHYVPQAKEATSEPPKPDSGPDMLSKILSASKTGQGKGPPQFVVFAPSPVEHEEDDDDMSSRVTRKTVRKRKKPRKEIAEYEDDTYPENTFIKPQVTSHVPRPRHGDYESNEFHQQQWPVQNHQQHNNYNQNYQHQQMPCCQHQQPPPPTEPPKGITIQMGQGLPASPLGMLRQLLRPKVDLKKKLFFGIQLENGMGFGGETGEGTTNSQMGKGGNMGGGHMGGGHMGGGNMGGQMYRFGR